MSNVNINIERHGFSFLRDIQALILNQVSLPCDTVSLPNSLVIWGFLFYSPRKSRFKSFLHWKQKRLKRTNFSLSTDVAKNSNTEKKYLSKDLMKGVPFPARKQIWQEAKSLPREWSPATH